MDFERIAHFLFIPTGSSGSTGTAFELEPISHYEQNCFVLIPYQNPQQKETLVKYYKIKSKEALDLADFKKGLATADKIRFRSRTSKELYLKKIKELKEHIQQGNIYEINYCIQFFTDAIKINPIAVFLKLHALAKAPYSALFKSGDEFIISTSPELFLKKTGSQLSTKPIKGTIRRGLSKEEDDALKDELYHDIKERTEHVMAVDVARNDLSHLATKGSVRVNKLYNIESFETVHQMVSTVSCELKDNLSFEDIVTATFPMASMTGAPKLRAMDLIDAFEDFERKAYSGSMGLVDANGDFSLWVIIRSIFYDQKKLKLSLSVGGAITYLSEAEKEYDECLLKAKAMLSALEAVITD